MNSPAAGGVAAAAGASSTPSMSSTVSKRMSPPARHPQARSSASAPAHLIKPLRQFAGGAVRKSWPQRGRAVAAIPRR
jgi:hypothetical protein